MNSMTPDWFEEMRHAMVVCQLRPDGVTDARVIDAMSRVPREDYVPEDRRATAYADRSIAMGEGRGMNPPTVTGRMLSDVRIGGGDRVLIVGAATGYTAAVVGELCNAVSSVDTDLAGLNGTFDVIVIDGAVDAVPDALIAALAPTGRLVTGIVEGSVTRIAIGRRGGSGFALVPVLDAEMIVLSAFARPPAFVF